MTRTSFYNASGLPNDAQLTTARDMSRLLQRLIKDFPQYKHYLGLPAAQVAGRRIEGHNRLLKTGACTGGKTGFIRVSGYNLVAWKESGNRLVIGAVFGGRSIAARDGKMTTLLQAGISSAIPRSDIQELVEANLRETTDTPPPAPRPRPDMAAIAATAETTPDRAALSTIITQANETIATQAQSMEASADDVLTVTDDTGLPEGVREAIPSSFTLPMPTIQNSWAIQVGAYRDPAQAHRALMQATRQLPTLLGPAFPRAIATSTNMGQLFRAQLVGLDESAAQKACAFLAGKGVQCLTIPAGQTS